MSKKIVESVEVIIDRGPSTPLFYIYSKRHDSMYHEKSEPFWTRAEAEMVASERFEVVARDVPNKPEPYIPSANEQRNFAERRGDR